MTQIIYMPGSGSKEKKDHAVALSLLIGLPMTTSESGSDDEKQRLREEVSDLRRKAENQEARIQEYRKMSEQILQGTGTGLAMRVWLKDARQQSEELRVLFEQVWSLCP
jgi:hypothetical protein